MAVRDVRRGLVAICAFAGLLQIAAPGSAHGQAPTEPPRRAILSINPLGIPFEYLSAEFETKISNMASFGLTTTYFGFASDDAYMATVDSKWRLYPDERWPRGFSIGVSAGLMMAEDYRYDSAAQQSIKENKIRPTMGVNVDYNWLKGRSKTIVVGTGVGAKRVLGADGDYNNVPSAYPTFRFLIGVNF